MRVRMRVRVGVRRSWVERVDAELSGARDVLARVVNLCPLLKQLFLQRSPAPREPDLVITVFIQTGAVCTARFFFATFNLASFAVPI